MESKKEEPEKILIEEFLNGNEKAFNELVRKYQKGIYWHARRMVGNHLDADEITQQVIIVMYKKLSSFKGNSSLKTWIYRITSNRCLNFIRRRKIKAYLNLDDVEASSLKNDEDILTNLEDRELLENVQKVLDELPLKQKEIFIYRHFDGLNYSEISEITGKSIGGLKANYFHAAKKVLKMVGK